MAVDDDTEEHRQWVERLVLEDRLIYDRAFGKAWSKGKTIHQCRHEGRKAVTSPKPAKA